MQRKNMPVHRTALPHGILAIVPCSKTKIWSRNFLAGPTPAKDAYISSAFRLHRRYAETFASEWRILSAWYGFLHPEHLIEDYDAKFQPTDLDARNWWRLTALYHQACGLPRFERVILLGGDLYRQIAKRCLIGMYLPGQINEPFRGHSLLETMRALKAMLNYQGSPGS